jgi:hypothetical protein
MKQNAGAQVLEVQGLTKSKIFLTEESKQLVDIIINYEPIFDKDDDWSKWNYNYLKFLFKE